MHPTTLRNATAATSGWATPRSPAALPPLLDHVLRRCPLLPSEVARIEQSLQALLDAATPEQVARQLVAQLEQRPPAQRQQVHAQVLAALHATPPPAPGTAWHSECRRVLGSLLAELHRLQGSRAAGMALYAVTNRLLGEHGVQALSWAQHSQAVATLLAQNAWLPWLGWLGQLPLPSLRGGSWLEPLLAALPAVLTNACSDLAAGHEALHGPPASPLRLVLLATVWMLWAAHGTAPIPPHSATGRRIARLPQVLRHVDDATHAARRLFAPPGPVEHHVPLPGLLTMATAAGAARGLTRGPLPRGAVPVAAVVSALAGLGTACAVGVPAAGDVASVDERAALIETLWMLHDTAPSQGSIDLNAQTLPPMPPGAQARQLREIRQVLGHLYAQDDFLATLYVERVPPCTLQMDNATLSGRRVNSDALVQLHPPPQDAGTPAWSPGTATLLRQLQAAVQRAGQCYHNAQRPLRCALQFQLDAVIPASNVTVPALAGLILQLEQRLPEDDGVTAAHEAATLQHLHQDLAWAKAQPLRGVEPIWRLWRPDPRSHLGHNLALARRMLRQLSEHPAFAQVCAAHGADRFRVEFPARGAVTAAARGGDAALTLFVAEAPPAALRPLAIVLGRLAALLHAPVRSSGLLQVAEMLDYYGVPWPRAVPGDSRFDTGMAAIERQLALSSPPPRATARTSGSDDVPAPRPARQAVADALWQVVDGTDAATPVQLQDIPFIARPGTPLHAHWADAQQRLLRLFEQPELWLPMRRADASFPSLRVAADHILAADRTTGRRLRLNLTATAPPGPDMQRLHRLAAGVGCIAPSGAMSLRHALTFHGVALRASAGDCGPPAPVSRWQLLSLLQQLHSVRAGTEPEATLHFQAIGDLHDVRRWHGVAGNASDRVYRPSLDTTTGTILYDTLGSFAALFAHARVNASVPGIHDSLRLASIDAGGLLTAQLDDGARLQLNTTLLWSDEAALAPVLKTLRTGASRLGGALRSDGRVAPAQVLALQGGCAEPDPRPGSALLYCTERVLGELRLGMRPPLVHARDLLDDSDLQRVRDATRAFLAQHDAADLPLLHFLGAPLVAAGRFDWNETHRLHYLLSEMARSAPARGLQQALLAALGWYGGNGTASTSPTLLGSLTVQALVADLGPPSRRAQRIVLGYRLHKHANRGRTFAAIREDFSTYLFSLGRLPPALHAMAVQLVLQEEAPELLGTDLPAPLVFGSAVAAVDYVSGVHLADRLQRGLWAQMNFSTLLTFAADLSNDPDVPPDVRQMALDARRLPLLDWQVFRGMDAVPALNATPWAPFNARVAQIQSAIDDLLAPLPYRMPWVEAELQRVFPQFPGVFAGLPWNATDMRLCNDRDWFGHSFPLFELYAAGELLRVREDWYPCRHYVPDTPLSRAQGHEQHAALHNQTHAALQRGFAQLANVTARFERAFDAYFDSATRGYGVLIEEALYLRPAAERDAIARGEVEIFTLRTHSPDLEAQQETAADTHPYRGRFGVVYALVLDGRTQYFQLFPLQSRILPLDHTGTLPLNGALETRTVRLRHGRHATVLVRRGTPLNVDWNAYAIYQAPVAGARSSVIVERLHANASAIEPPSGQRRSPFHALVAPLQRDFFWLDREAFHYEARSLTSFEAHLKEPPLWLKAVEFVVPFVANLRKIGSADRDEFALAAFGLYLEGVLIAWPLTGGMFKVLARPGPTLTLPRFTALAQALGRGTLDALNPLAGTVMIARLGAGVVRDGVGGGLQYVWSWLHRPRLYPGRWYWTLHAGMAVLRGGRLPDTLPLRLSVRTVHDMADVLVIANPSSASHRGFHLLDPATLTPYGPALREQMDSSNAAGVLFKVGEGLRVKPSAGKALKPIKQGSKASQEDSGEQPGLARLRT